MASNQILSLYNSRKTILELLTMENYDITGYDGFSQQEVESMLKHAQLDMLVIRNKEQTNEMKIYVKYYLGKTFRNNLKDIIEDLFESSEGEEPTLKKTDTLVVIADDDPNETVTKNIRYRFDNEGIHIIVFNIKRLQFNVRKHILNPAIRILTEEETEKLKTEMKIKNLSQLPEVSRFDPLTMSVFVRPNQICHYIRDCPTSITEEYYRVCC